MVTGESGEGPLTRSCGLGSKRWQEERGARPPRPQSAGAWEGSRGGAWDPLILPTHRDLVRLPAALCAHTFIGRGVFPLSFPFSSMTKFKDPDL